jgi:hypothetical protein
MNAAKDSSPKGVEVFIGLGTAKIRQLENLLERELALDTSLPKRRPVQRFKTWLAQRTMRLANLWRFRKRITPDLEVKKFEFLKIGNLASPYRAYRELFQKSMEGEYMAESRLDAMIALRIRLSGYNFGDVGNKIYRQARPLRQEQEHREWKDYARRMVIYAFGVAGDIDIAAFKPTAENI